MRILLLVALAIAAVMAEPEADANADPYYGYRGYGYGYPSRYGVGNLACGVCTREYKPVCGSDGQNYNNKCLLEYEQCVKRILITVVKEGACDSESNQGDRYYGVEELISSNCPIACTREYLPVCGSNGVTYDNDCHLNQAECVERTLITAVHYGICETNSDPEEGTLGYYGHPGYLHSHGGLPILRNTVIATEAKPVVKVESIVGRVLNAPFGVPYRYGPTVSGVGPKESIDGRVLNAPFGVPYRYGPTVSGVGPKADAFGRRYWW